MADSDLAQQTVHPVQMQLEAYNAKDIDEFVRLWAADCEYSVFPDQVVGEPRLHGERAEGSRK